MGTPPDFDLAITIAVREREWSASPRAETSLRFPLETAIDQWADGLNHEPRILAAINATILDLLTKQDVFTRRIETLTPEEAKR